MAVWISNYMVRLALSPSLVQIKAEFGLSYAEAGLLASAFFYAYTVMQAPAGYLGDRFGRKLMICLSNAGWTLGSLLTALAGSFHQVFAFRFATGVAEGALFSNDRPVAAAFTPSRVKGKGIGVSFTGLGIGMFLGIALGGFIAEAAGWRMVFLAFSIPSALTFLLALKVLREPPQAEGGKPPRGKSVLFKHRSLWMLYFAGIPVIYSLWVLGTWAPVIFMELGVKSLFQGSLYASLLGLASIPGLWFSGVVSDKFRGRGLSWRAAITLFFTASILCMFAVAFALEAKVSGLILALLIFLAGFSFWGIWAPFYALTADITHPSMHGTAYGVLNSIHFIGSIAAPWLTGFLRDLTGSFTAACQVSALLMVAGLISLMMVKPAFSFTCEDKAY